MKTKVKIILSLLFLYSLNCLALPKSDKVSLKYQDVPLRTALKNLARQTPIDIVYGDDLVENLTVTCDFEKMPLQSALKQLLQDKPVTFRVVNENQVVLVWRKNHSNALITGKVIDEDTGLPLDNVNVFLANSLIGSATDKYGLYKIVNIPPGSYVLIVSRIGYKVEKLKLRIAADTTDRQINFSLYPRVLQAPEIAISAADIERRKKNLEEFIEHFLGTSRNASQCTLLNPVVLDFKKEGRPRRLTARAAAPLQIENRALGYRLYFVLDEFTLEAKEVRFLGNAKFEQLAPKNRKEENLWQQNRLKTYRGSLKHFLTATFNERLEHEGFYVYRRFDLQQDSERFQAKIDEHNYLSSGEQSSEKKLHFPDYLDVTYTGELEEGNYIDYKLRHLYFRQNPYQQFLRAQEPGYQRSWITLKQEAVTIDNSGYLSEPLALKTYGYWAWRRVGDMLPREFAPSTYSPEKAESKETVIPADLKKKLDGWIKAQQIFPVKGEVDPRIGIALIELATKNKATEYYEQACDLYYRSFSRANINKYKKEIADEIARIIPLLDEEQAKKWRDDLKSANPDLTKKIKTFWIEKDPTPTTLINERLLEHWERIAYARKHFTKNNYGVYDCDDRGTIYVKYGKPLRKKTGAFGTSSASTLELMRWVENPRTRSEIKLLDKNPEYEVWLYGNLGTDDPAIFLFANREGSGSFGLQEGVELALPNLGYRYDFKFGFKYIYQIMYYAELMSFAALFEKRYTQLEELRQSGSNFKQLRAIYESNRLTDRTSPSYKYAEADKSNVEESFAPINVVTQYVRFLDKRNRPKQTIIAISSPEFQVVEPEKADKSAERFEIPDYQLKHTLIIRDAELLEIERKTDVVAHSFDNISVFTLEHRQKDAHYTVAAEAVEAQADTLLGMGRAFLRPSAPLSSDPDSLELSDLVLGVEFPPDSEASKFPFPLLPAKQIWRHDPLKVYLEVYHLKPGADRTGQFTIDFAIAKLDKKGRVKKKAGEISLTFEFEAIGRTSREDFSIDISKLKPGEYQLLARVKDRVSSQKKSRSTKLTVLKN